MEVEFDRCVNSRNSKSENLGALDFGSILAVGLYRFALTVSAFHCSRTPSSWVPEFQCQTMHPIAYTRSNSVQR